MEPIQIRMLGQFTLQSGNNILSETDNRSRKVWMLLAYLICHRGQTVSQKRLIELLWGNEPASSNPENAALVTDKKQHTCPIAKTDALFSVYHFKNLLGTLRASCQDFCCPEHQRSNTEKSTSS